MTKRKEVSEKTLELNVCAELLQHIRTWRGCEAAVWFGLTQRQERERGLDELICNAPGLALMLQFKSPWARSSAIYPYRFSINQAQHKALEKLSRNYPEAVYYVLPLYNKWTKVGRDAPELTKDTWLMPASCISLDPTNSTSTPTIDLMRVNSRIVVSGRGLEVKCRPITTPELYLATTRNQLVDAKFMGVPSSALFEWVQQWGDSALRFHGLNALYAPD